MKRSTHTTFPNTLGPYRFMRLLTDVDSRNPSYDFAVYTDKKGKLALAKRYVGERSGWAYRTLLSEAAALQMLGATESMQSGWRVSTPTYVGHHEENDSLILLTAYVKGKKASDLSSHERAGVFENVLRHMESRIAGHSLRSRPGWTLVAMYPLTLVVAILRNPTFAAPLLKAGVAILGALKQILVMHADTLAHRDVHGDNMLVSARRIWIVDMQLLARTIPSYDSACALILNWHDETLRHTLMQRLERMPGKSGSALVGLIATHYLMDRNVSEKTTDAYRQALTYVWLAGSEAGFLGSVVKWIGQARSLFLTIQKSKPAAIQPPDTLGAYTFTKDIHRTSTYPYVTALYRDAKGHKVVIKFWSGNVRNGAYYSLQREIRVYKGFAEVAKRKPSLFSQVSVPELVGVINEPGRLVVITRFVEGKQGAATHADTMRVTGFLKDVSDHLTKGEKRDIGFQGISYYLMMYPILVVFAVLRHPGLAGTIVGMIPAFLRSLPDMVGQTPPSVVHGDLHGGNIIRQGKKLVIVDFAQLMVTYALAETVTMILSPLVPEHVAEALYRNIPLSDGRLSGGLFAFFRTFTLLFNNEDARGALLAMLTRAPHPRGRRAFGVITQSTIEPMPAGSG